MNYKKDYGTNILIVKDTKNQITRPYKDYYIIRNPDYSFQIYDNQELEYRQMEYIEDNLLNLGEQFTIDVERIGPKDYYCEYIFAGQVISSKKNNKNGFFVIKCILETENVKNYSIIMNFYLILDKKKNEYVYIQNNEKIEDPVDDTRHSLKFLELEAEIFMLFFKVKPTLNMNMEIFDKHKKFPNKIEFDYYTNDERHYFD